MCVCLVSAENLEKSLRQMEKHLLQLEKDLDTFSSADDPQDLFLSKMAISFHVFAHTQYFLFSLLFCLNTFLHCCFAINIVHASVRGSDTFSSTLQPHTFTNANQSLCLGVQINYLYWTSPGCMWNRRQFDNGVVHSCTCLLVHFPAVCLRIRNCSLRSGCYLLCKWQTFESHVLPGEIPGARTKRWTKRIPK